MTPEAFLETFDQLAEVPGAVARLREVVLHLAFTGRLCSQSPLADLASTQEAEHAVPATRRRAGAQDAAACPGTQCEAGERLYPLPRSWRWVRLAELGPELLNGASSRGNHDGVPVVVLRLADVVEGRISLRQPRVLPMAPDSVVRYSLRDGDILVTRVNGSADIVGTFILVTGDFRAIYCDHFIRMRLAVEALDPSFLAALGRTRLVRDQVKRLFVTTAGQKTVNQKHIGALLIPLPPLAEQKRIVARVDELMALCDRLEALQQEREQKHAALARAALARFSESPTPANLEFLFHTSYDIAPADLRKAILTLAVQGKLVPQDPSDEPASACLARLGLRSTSQRQEPGVVPSSWACVLFDDVAAVSGGLTLGRKLHGRRTVSLPYLRVANVKRGVLDLGEVKEVLVPEDEVERYTLRKNDLLMAEGGDWDKVGRAAVWTGKISPCLHQNHVFRARMRSEELGPVWFERYFNSPVGRSYFESASKQTTNLASINMRQVRGCPVPVPPLAEQRRIVAKVDQLMALVDQLEAQIAAARAAGETLMAAAIAGLTGSA